MPRLTGLNSICQRKSDKPVCPVFGVRLEQMFCSFYGDQSNAV